MSRRYFLNEDAPAATMPAASLSHRELGPHQWARDALERLRGAKTGDGVDDLCFDVAKGFLPYHSSGEVAAILTAATANAGRDTRRTIARAVTNAAQFTRTPPVDAVRNWTPPEQRPLVPPPPARNQELIAKTVAANPKTVQDLRDHGCRGGDEGARDPDKWIDALFPGNPLLCAGASPQTAETQPREAWRGKLGGLSFCVSSPMSGLTGLTKEGRTSSRCEGNTGPRHYAVLESDGGTKDEQAAVLWTLIHADQLPVVMIVDSGGKSLHAWVYVKGASEAEIDALFRRAIELGADPSTRQKCQMIRLPDGLRDNGRRQSVVYWNADLLLSLQKGAL